MPRPAPAVLAAIAAAAFALTGRAAPPTRAATLTGVYEPSPKDYAAAEAWFGKPFDGATVFIGNNGWADYDGSVGYVIDWTRGMARRKFWSIALVLAQGSSLQEAAAGPYDPHWRAIAAKVLADSPPDGPIYVRTGWEFNATWMPWSALKDPAGFVAAFRRFVDVWRTVSPRFVFTWCPALGANGMNPESAYPGDAWVDIIGEDFYFNRQYNLESAATFGQFVAMPYGLQWQQDFAAAHHKGTATPEWGVNSDAGAGFVTLAARWFDSHHEVYQAFWDTDAAFPGGKLSDGSKPLAAAAFKSAIGAITRPPR